MKKVWMFIVGCILIVVLYLVTAWYAERRYNGGLGVRARAYPVDTIEIRGERFLVVEVHDYKKGDIYDDTIRMPNRVPSTLEDFDHKWRRYRLGE